MRERTQTPATARVGYEQGHAGEAPVADARAAHVPGMHVPDVLRVLIVEDNPGDARLLTRLLREPTLDGPAFTCRSVGRLAEARAALAAAPADVILLDLSLPDGHELESLQVIREAAPEAPIVVMTGLDDDEVAVRAVQAGAQDYLVKGSTDAGAIRRAVRSAVERQRLVRAAQEAARMRDEVLAVVSHDLRNPLATISMCAHVLLDQTLGAPEHVRSMGEIIHRSAEWMQRLIGDLLDVASIEAGSLALHEEALPVGSVLDTLASVFTPIAAGQGVAFGISEAPGLPRLHADADRVFQALGNIVGNAIKFTTAGGRVTVAAERAPRDDGREAVRITVTDTGCGIAPEHLPLVFDRFWQVREQRRGGAGLGLAIAKGIVEAHGGTIAVASEPGAGTTFTCTLPTVPPAPRAD